MLLVIQQVIQAIQAVIQAIQAVIQVVIQAVIQPVIQAIQAIQAVGLLRSSPAALAADCAHPTRGQVSFRVVPMIIL